jgi:hypothetical protein
LAANPNVKPQIIVSGDHGFTEGGTTHNIPDVNTKTVILSSNNASLIRGIYNTARGRQQCDLVPTIINYFGMNSSTYPEITRGGCGSLIL